MKGLKAYRRKRLLKFINEREKSLLDNTVVLALIYLDPRIRRLFPKEKLEETKKFLKSVASHMIQVKSLATSQNVTLGPAAIRMKDPTPPQPDCSSSLVNVDEESNDSLLNKFLDRIGSSDSDDSDEDHNLESTLGAAIKKIEEYTSKRITLTADILVYWSNLKYKWPFFSKIALIVHAVPATQVTVERAFPLLSSY